MLGCRVEDGVENSCWVAFVGRSHQRVCKKWLSASSLGRVAFVVYFYVELLVYNCLCAIACKELLVCNCL